MGTIAQACEVADLSGGLPAGTADAAASHPEEGEIMLLWLLDTRRESR